MGGETAVHRAVLIVPHQGKTQSGSESGAGDQDFAKLFTFTHAVN